VGGAAVARIGTGEDGYDMARGTFEALVALLRSEQAHSLSHSGVESLLDERGRALLLELLQAHIDSRGTGAAAAPVVGADGVKRDDERTHERELPNLFGSARVKRLGYGAEGVDSLHPLDAELNLPQESYSFGLRRRAAEDASKVSFDETVASLAKTTGTPVPKRQVEQLVARAAQDFDAFYEHTRNSAGEQDGAEVLVVTLDAKGVVMHQADLREATRKKALGRRRPLGSRLTRGEKKNAKRMATVAAVYTVAPFVRTPAQFTASLAGARDPTLPPRPRPQHKRVWASLERDPEVVTAQALDEAHSRDPDRSKTWVALVDGNPDQLRILSRLSAERGIRFTILLDIIHVCEYVWKASLCFHEQTDRQREVWVLDRVERILHGQSSQVAAGMTRSATLRKLPLDKRKAVDDCAGYLLNHKPYLRYDRALAAGLPIATGVIEGACRYLIKDRMDITGARWRLKAAEAVLRLRALRKNGDFDEYWTFHEQQEYQRNHASRYAGGRVVPIRGRHLTRAK
jgi:hypothetical protein